MFSAIKKIPFIIAINAALAVLQGCSEEKSPEAYIAWVHEYRCPERAEGPGLVPSCKRIGQLESGAILEFRFFPTQHSILVHVVVQDPKNLSLDIHEITGCKIWDRDNWDCTISNRAWTDFYSARDGILTHTFTGQGMERLSIPNSETVRIGHLHEGRASGWKRYWFTEVEVGINSDKTF